MRVRIYKTPDGEVVVDTPSQRYQDKIEECPHPGRFRNGEIFEMEVKDLSEVDAIASKNEAGSAQFYYNGKVLKHDDDWEECLMPKSCIISRHIRLLEDEIDAELEKDDPDLTSLLRKERELKAVPKMSDVEVYSLALSKLTSEGKKPKIQIKLQKKISKFGGK